MARAPNDLHVASCPQPLAPEHLPYSGAEVSEKPPEIEAQVRDFSAKLTRSTTLCSVYVPPAPAPARVAPFEMPTPRSVLAFIILCLAFTAPALAAEEKKEKEAPPYTRVCTIYLLNIHLL